MKAFSYNPLYLADQSCLQHPGASQCTSIINDDVSAEWAEMMWSPEGRGDIEIMATLGANTVRLYGNDPRFTKRKFFDELLSNKMKAVTGLSNYPFVNPSSPRGCIYGSAYNCFENATETYAMLLTTGEFAKNGYYHNALEIVSLMNEPDIWLWSPGGWNGPNNYIKALVTAFDGVLSAEKQANIKPWKNGKLPKFTIGWSYALMRKELCSKEGYISDPASECGPGIGFMSQFYHAIHDPQGTVQYKPQNDLAQAYKDRWINSLQPFVGTPQLWNQAIQPAQTLPSLMDVKIYLGEYDPAVDLCGDKPSCKNYGKDQLQADMKTILTDEGWKKNVLGVSFFEFQQAYNKYQPHELAYGMFNLTADTPWTTSHIEGDSAPNHPINCLDWKTKDLAQGVAAAYGGSIPTLRCKKQVLHGAEMVI